MINPERSQNEPFPETPQEESAEQRIIYKEPYVTESEGKVSFLGVEVPKGQGGRLVPEKEEFGEEYTFLEGHYKVMREVATSLLLNKPILLEGGTGVYNKTTTMAYMCHLLNMNYCKVNMGREVIVDDVIGGKEIETDEAGHEVFKWHDGRLMYAIKNGGVAFLDEYNRQSKLAEVINPIIDAILNGRKEIINPLNKDEMVKVHPDFRLVAAQNPPGFEGGHTYEGRSPLPTETFGRWIFQKLPIEYTEEEENKRLAGMMGVDAGLNIPESEFRHTGEGLPIEKLAEIPGMEPHWRREIVTIQRVLREKSTGAKREMAKGQKQELSFNPRLQNTLLKYIATFYSGDINETVKNAFETCVVGMYSSEADKSKVRLMLDQAQWKAPAGETKRKGLEREKKKEESTKGEGPESIQEARKKAEDARESLLKSPKVPAAIKEKLRSAEAGTELESSLQEQYERQVEIMQKLGIVEALESGELGIKGIDGKEYALPTQAEIVERMEANKELVERKQEQGFTRLLLVPFGMKINDLSETYKQAILRHRKDEKLFATKKNPGDSLEPLELDEDNPLWMWDGYNDADATGKLVYNPKEFSENHKGQTKQEILAEQGGWQVLLIEDMPNIPREGGAKEKGGRKQIDTKGTSIRKYVASGKNYPSPAEYLNALQKEKVYQGESGMTPEAQLAYSIINLEETDQVIDDYQGNGSVSYQIGAYFPSSGFVPYACWSRGDRQAGVGRYDPDYRSGSCGVRPAVRI